MDDIYIFLDHEDRNLNFLPHLRSVGYTNKMETAQIVEHLTICFRLSGHCDELVHTIDNEKHAALFPHLFIKPPYQKILINTAEVSSFFFTYHASSMPYFIANGLPKELILFPITFKEKMNTIFNEAMKLIYHSREYGVPDMLDLLCYQLLQEALLEYKSHLSKFSSEERKILKVASYIQLHYRELGSMKDLSRRFGLSRRNFFRCWRNWNKLPPLQYAFELKMKEAQRLLRESEMSIMEIAENLNYSEASNFCVAFKRHFGLTPLQFRNSRNAAIVL